jgi:phospholipid-binding lipoprotein MlaA
MNYLMPNRWFQKTILIIGLLLGVIGCASKKNPDPYENYNRIVFKFNAYANYYMLAPLSRGYNRVVPSKVQDAFGNFFYNTNELSRIVNDGLQGKWAYMGNDSIRFIINTTIGLGGLFDFASDMGFKRHYQSFGITLAQWGYSHSPYFILPIYGPVTVRGGIGLVPDYFMNPFNIDFYFNPDPIVPEPLSWGLAGVYGVNTYAKAYKKREKLTAFAIDPYIAVRSGYLQYIKNQIKINNKDKPFGFYGHSMSQSSNSNSSSFSGNAGHNIK